MREPLFQAEGSGKVEGAGKEDAWECAEKWNGADNTPFAMGYRRNNAGSEAEQQKLRDEAVKTAADADAVLFSLLWILVLKEKEMTVCNMNCRNTRWLF